MNSTTKGPTPSLARPPACRTADRSRSHLRGAGHQRRRANTPTARVAWAGDSGTLLAAPLEARRPSVHAPNAQVAELRPDLPGLSDYAHRAAGCPL